MVSDDTSVSTDVSMKDKTSFHIGGCADVFVEVASPNDVIETTRFCKKNNVEVFVIGKGSNLLVADCGIRGVVIRIASKMSDVSANDTVITAQAGASNAKVAKLAAGLGLSGYGFASGIPGTVGGSLRMNAGAYEHEMSDIVAEVTCLDRDLGVQTYVFKDEDFGYRNSRIAREGLVVLEASFQLTPEDPEKIRAEMREMNLKRAAFQPLGQPSAGSAFKRVQGVSAAALIEQAGLKGFSVGGARVSEKHSGFIVNDGDATAADVRALMETIQKRVFGETGIVLQPEIIMIGFE